jgi:hypothetical protein
VVGDFAVTSRPRAASTASVKVPPTSTPSSTSAAASRGPAFHGQALDLMVARTDDIAATIAATARFRERRCARSFVLSWCSPGASSAKDGSLACLVQARVRLAP